MAESLLIDTTYLLPLFGLESQLSDYNVAFPRLLEDYDVKYNPISLLEAKWLVLRLAKKRKNERATFLKYYRQGIGAIYKEEKLQQSAFTAESVEALSDRILIELELKDYFDRQIYSTAAQLSCILLTEDEDLHNLYKSEIMPKPKAVVRWKDMARRK